MRVEMGHLKQCWKAFFSFSGHFSQPSLWIMLHAIMSSWVSRKNVVIFRYGINHCVSKCLIIASASDNLKLMGCADIDDKGLRLWPGIAAGTANTILQGVITSRPSLAVPPQTSVFSVRMKMMMTADGRKGHARRLPPMSAVITRKGFTEVWSELKLRYTINQIK